MKKQFYSEGFKLGILGGGQLGKMFIQEAINYNAAIYILDGDANAPCSRLAHEFTCGSISDYQTVYNWGKNMDLITIEIEHVNVEALEQLEKDGISVYPQPAVIKMVQDKGLQKEFYKQNNIPSAHFILVNNKAEISNHIAHFPWMQKLRKGGYDGKGVQALKTPADLSKAFDAPSVLEDFCDLDKEIAVIVARSANGEIKTFPVVELEFNPEANLVEFLFAPANISQEVEDRATAIAKNVIEALDMVGILAVELFLTKDGEVLVNEIAPRPHNSGHHTIEANFTSQYEQHFRAIVGLPLGSTDTILPAVMVNVLGEKEFTGNAIYQGLEECTSIEGVFVHLYGKKTTKPFRKMGHITIINHELEEAIDRARQVQALLKVISE